MCVLVGNSTLPVRREILLGILNCDLIGFHTYDYARHFLSSVSRLLGLKCLPNRESIPRSCRCFARFVADSKL